MTQRSPKPPSDLSAESRLIWRLVHEGWPVGDAGRPVLMIALRAEDRAAKGRELLKRDGLVVQVGKGSTRAHPALQIVKDSELIALKAWRQLGLQEAPAGAPGRPPGVV